MTTRARHAEADRAAKAFQAALAAQGARTVAEALVLWKGVPPELAERVRPAWLRSVLRIITRRRRATWDLGIAYYRYVRALRINATVALPGEEGGSTTLEELRDAFRALAPSMPKTGAVGNVKIESIGNLEDDRRRLETAARREAIENLTNLGTSNLAKKVKKIDLDQSSRQVQAEVKEAHKSAGARQAASAERYAINAARSAVWNAGEKDPKAVGYVRLSRTGTPCGWCAMLISRGPVYKTEKSAVFSDGDKYHDNCNCFAEPVFVKNQYEKSNAFSLNREYQDLWPKVTKGLSGKAALSEWRKFIRSRNDQ